MPKISPAAAFNTTWSPHRRDSSDEVDTHRKPRWKQLDPFITKFRAFNENDPISEDNPLKEQKPRAMFARKLFLLLWKNWLIRWRHPVLFFVEIGAIGLFFGIMLLVKVQLAQNAAEFFEPNATVFDVISEREVLGHFLDDIGGGQQKILMYSPNSSQNVKGIMDEFYRLAGKPPKLELRGFESEDAMLKYVDNLALQGLSSNLKGAVVFQESTVFSNKIDSKAFSYKIRLSGFRRPTQMLFSPVSLPGPGLKPEDQGGEYVKKFAPLQYLVDASILGWVCQSPQASCPVDSFENDTTIRQGPLTPIMKNFNIEVQPFPYPPYTEALQEFLSFLFGIMLPQFTVYAFLFLVPIIHMGVVKEKQSGVKELMKMMGMSRLLYWSSWLLSCLMSSILPVTIAIIICVVPLTSDGAIYKQSDASIIIIFYILYTLAFIAFAFSITTIFDRLLKTIPIGILFMLLTYMAPTFSLNLWNVSGEGDGAVGKNAALALCLMPNMAMVYGVRVAFAFEGRGTGIQWTNLNNAPYLKDGMTMMSVYFMLIFDIFFYMLLTMYLDTIKPGQYGVGAPFYFPFQLSFWFPKRERAKEAKADALRSSLRTSTSKRKRRFFEDEPTHLQTGIEIVNLKKAFRTMEGTKVAVSGLSLKVYKGQITALLGHNGAGKTTTMSILTGLYAPSSGTAMVDGYDITTSMDRVREKMGLCPQFSMLFPEIKVIEHLLLFGQLKGLSKSQAAAEGRDLMQRLNLYEKRNAMADNLSGGQKRKLSLAMALIGDSEIVILDEPTSGMDPEARRNMWDYLQEQKGKRTILLTTHFMEEADVLGDRIAIMAEGKLQCCGTPMYLKNQYGTGITLSMLKQESEDWKMVKSIVKSQLPSATVKSESGNELSFKLPQNERAVYPSLLNALESRRDELGILNFSISSTTMEEVFLKVGEGLDNEDGSDSVDGSDIEELEDGTAQTEFIVNGNGVKNGYPSYGTSGERITKRRNEGLNLSMQRLRAVVTKKMMYLYRKWSLIISQLLLPLLCLIAALLIDDAANKKTSNPYSLKLSPSAYTPSNYFYKSVETGTPEELNLGKLAADSYKTFVSSFASDSAVIGVSGVPQGTSMNDFLLSRGSSQIVRYRTEDLAAANFVASGTASRVTVGARAMFQTIPWHSAGVAVNAINNAVIRTVTNMSDIKVDVYNQPLPRSRIENVIQNFPIETNGTGPIAFANMDSNFIYTLLWCTGCFLIACSFLVFPVEERACGSKQLQLMTGMKPTTYWLGHIIGDTVVMQVAIILMLIALAVVNASGIFLANGATAIGAIFVLLMLYCFAAMPFAYFHSYWFSTPGTGFAIHIMDNLLFGAIATSIVVLLETAGTDDLKEGAIILKWICRFIPPFPFSHAVFLLIERAYNNNRCAFIPDDLKNLVCVPFVAEQFLPPSVQACCPTCGTGNMASCFKPKDFLAWDEPGIGVDLLMLIVSGLLFYVIMFILETGIHRRITQSCYSQPKGSSNGQPIDVDVARENERVQDMITNKRWTDDALVVNGLKKVFKELVAVDNISLGVHHGECFGLLGVNGAGKTTTFRMLTGDEVKTAGKAYLLGNDLDSKRSAFLKQTGYCPQFDGLVDVLTGDEMLYLFCRLRGMPEELIAEHVKDLIVRLGLQNHWSRRCGYYSGGNKRKLSTAIAMAADPAILFLDEPTSGVDPVSRRRIWKALTTCTNNGQAVVLTSHSMEECEALCQRLGIMVNGRFQCLGPVQHLKQKFCEGYSVQIKLNPKEGDPQGVQLQAVKSFVESRIPQSYVQDQHEGLVHYHIKDPNTTWQLIFATMEEARKTWPTYLEDYAVGETTLEQIFISFARYQLPDANRYKTKCCLSCCGRKRRDSEDAIVVRPAEIGQTGFTNPSFEGLD